MIGRREYDMGGWDPENDEHDMSIDTDHHSSIDKRRTAPEAPVEIKLAKDFISTSAWRIFAEQTGNAVVDRFSAPIPRSDSTMKVKVQSPTPE